MRWDGEEMYIITSHSGLTHSENSNNLEHGDQPEGFSYKLRWQKPLDEYLIGLTLTGAFLLVDLSFPLTILVSSSSLHPLYLFSPSIFVIHAIKALCVLDSLHGWVRLCRSTSGEDEPFEKKILPSACKLGWKTWFPDSAALPSFFSWHWDLWWKHSLHCEWLWRFKVILEAKLSTQIEYCWKES